MAVWTDGGNATRKLVSAGERTLVAGKAAQIQVARQPKEIERKLAWREGKLIFSSQTLREAVADFNRYSVRKIVIVDPAIEGRRIFGQYQIDAPEQFARDIGAYLNVPIGVTADKIMIGRASRLRPGRRRRRPASIPAATASNRFQSRIRFPNRMRRVGLGIPGHPPPSTGSVLLE
jgi:hypothetical protein